MIDLAGIEADLAHVLGDVAGMSAQAGTASASNLPVSRMKALVEGRLTRDDIRTVIPDRTLDRRIAEKRNLTIDEADAILRLLRVTEAARRVFEDPARADHWLRSPNPSLDGAVPIRLARTDVGGRMVEAVLGRLEHGVFS